MNKRRARPNWFRIILLILLVMGAMYVNEVIIPTQPQYGVPTPTVTRAAESYVSEAQDLFNQGKLVKSIEAYRQAIISRPDDPTTHIALARTLVWAGQYQEAQSSAEDALLLNNNNAMAHAVLAWAKDFQGDYLGALTSIKKAMELDNQSAVIYAYYVEILLDSNSSGVGDVGAVETAIENSNKALALDPNIVETHRARGYLLEFTGNYNEAVTEYQAAININPNLADLHLSLGRNYRTLGIYDQAVNEFLLANALNPEDPTPDLYISRTYATIGEFGKARQYAKTAVDDNPADTNLRGNYGVMLYRDSYWNEALEQLGYVINGGVTADGKPITPVELTPNSPRIAEYFYTYGLALSRVNKCGEALRIAQLIQARIPSDETAMENANQITQRCTQNLTAPPPTAAETASATTETPTLEVTPTP
ncbi:MAG: tetratricopeptide repeat protein [Anaerolineales bacterium]|nr:tetratricopeptide repeat protein [Anaerolineales bacterium]